MFIINVALGNTSWRLLFKDEEKATHIYKRLTETSSGCPLAVSDDFGQTLYANPSSIHGFMLEDMDKTKMAHVEMALHQARTQSLATKMAQSDPALKAQSSMSPNVISPMNGFMPRQ